MNELHLAIIQLKTLLDEVAKPIADKGRLLKTFNMTETARDKTLESQKRFNFLKDLIGEMTAELMALQQEDFEDSLQYEDPSEEI